MYNEAKLRTLRTRGAGRLMTTDSASKELGISKQRWLRLARQPGFPKRYRVGRVWCIHPHALADFLEKQNALEAGMSLSDIAKYLHMTHYTAQALLERGELPPPLGTIKGRPRWMRETIDQWRLDQLGGAQPPPGVYERRGRAAGRAVA